MKKTKMSNCELITVTSAALISEPSRLWIPGNRLNPQPVNAIWGMGFAIVDARRKKLIKRLIATPMPRQYYLLSFLLSRLALLGIEVAAVAGFGHFVFGVPMRGSAAALAALCVLGSPPFRPLGVLIASRAQTIEAASGLMNA